MLGFPDCILYCLENLKSWTFISEFLSVLRLLLRERKESRWLQLQGKTETRKKILWPRSRHSDGGPDEFNLCEIPWIWCLLYLFSWLFCLCTYLPLPPPVCLSAWVITESPACPSHRLSCFGCAPASLCSARRKAHISGFMLHVE